MEMKLFFVVGPESSGCRMVTELLIRAGCFGSAKHHQEIDDLLDNVSELREYLKTHPTWVFRRSLPYGHRDEYRHFPDLESIVQRFKDAGMNDIHVVITSRAWPTMILSQIDMQHVNDWETGIGNIRTAFLKIFSFLSTTQLPFTMINYNALVSNRSVNLHWLMQELGFSVYYPHWQDVEFLRPGPEQRRVKEYRERFKKSLLSGYWLLLRL